MEMIFLGTGIILSFICIYKKYKFYRKKNHQSSEEISEKDNISLEKNHYRFLKKSIDDLRQELKKVNGKIEQKQKTLQQEIKNLNEKFVNNKVETNFNKILENKFEENFSLKKKDNLPKHYKEVCLLFEKGKAPINIARELDLGIRETNMVLKFYKKGEVENVN